MRHAIAITAVLPLLSVLVAACGAGAEEEPETPLAAFEAFQAACEARDGGKLFDLTCMRDRVELEEIKAEAARGGGRARKLEEMTGAPAAEIEAMSLREFAAKVIAANYDRPDRSLLEVFSRAKRLGDPDVSGKKAVIPWLGPDKVRGEMELVQEDGSWKVSFGRVFLPFQKRLERTKLMCMNNLRQIGALLVMRQTGGKSITRFSGAAFVLQVAPSISDEDLKVFVCPGEPPDAHPDRPEPGTPEFALFIRDIEEKLGKMADLGPYTSYAGPNWKDYPRNPTSGESRLWACCPHHDGVVCLWDSSKVTYLPSDEIEQGEDGIVVGPDAPDKHLRTMIVNPSQR